MERRPRYSGCFWPDPLLYQHFEHDQKVKYRYKNCAQLEQYSYMQSTGKTTLANPLGVSSLALAAYLPIDLADTESAHGNPAALNRTIPLPRY
jgi:hypothetical protein